MHRVQRVPSTESLGRIHTSTVTVALLPEAEEIDSSLQEKDLRVETMRSSVSQKRYNPYKQYWTPSLPCPASALPF